MFRCDIMSYRADAGICLHFSFSYFVYFSLSLSLSLSLSISSSALIFVCVRLKHEQSRAVICGWS
jgi:hypothetical protein